MDRFIYATDIHYGAKPITRKDVYNDSIIDKVEYILRVARKNKCIVLLGGDLFDTPKLSFLDANRLIRLFIEYQDVEVHCITGNESHDGIEDSSPLATLKYAGIIENEEFYKDFNETRVIFRGHNYDPTDISDFISPNLYNILMSHTTIVANPVIFEHVLIDDFPTKADMVTIGHYHPYQGILTRDDGVIFVAPGSVSRRKKTKSNMDKKPKMIFMSFEDKILSSMKEIVIPHTKDVWLERTVIEIDDSLLSTIKDEVENMGEIIDQNVGELSITDALKKFAKMKDVNENVLEYTLNRIGEI